jgi:Lon protease-like protein
MCREALHFTPEHPINVTLSNIIQRFYPNEYVARKIDEEKLSRQTEAHMPLFVLNTVAVPGQSFPLHVFEPRYRLMIRRCMAGDKLFGLIGAHRDTNGSWKMNEFGTVLKINDFKLLPDGRSYLGTVGTQRFRVVDTWIVDGYNAGRIEYYSDSPKDAKQVARENELLSNIVNSLRQISQNPDFFDGALRNFATYIASNIQKVPQNCDEASWWFLAMLPQNIDDSDSILRSRSTLERLQQTKQLLEAITSGHIAIH